MFYTLNSTPAELYIDDLLIGATLVHFIKNSNPLDVSVKAENDGDITPMVEVLIDGDTPAIRHAINTTPTPSLKIKIDKIFYFLINILYYANTLPAVANNYFKCTLRLVT